MNKCKLIGVCVAVFVALNGISVVSASNQNLDEREQEVVRSERLQVAQFPINLGNTSTLEVLDLSESSNLPDFDEENFIPRTLHFAGLFNSLKVLHIESNGLTRFPTNLGELSNLEELYISHNKCHLPTATEIEGKFSHLKILDISYNNLEEFPIVFGKLRELRNLNLSCNVLLNMPSPQLDKLYNKLKYLFFSKEVKEAIQAAEEEPFKQWLRDSTIEEMLERWLRDNEINEDAQTVEEMADELSEQGIEDDELQRRIEAYASDRCTLILEPLKEAQQIAPANFEGLFPKLDTIDMNCTGLLIFPKYLLNFPSLRNINVKNNFIMNLDGVQLIRLNGSLAKTIGWFLRSWRTEYPEIYFHSYRRFNIDLTNQRSHSDVVRIFLKPVADHFIIMKLFQGLFDRVSDVIAKIFR